MDVCDGDIVSNLK